MVKLDTKEQKEIESIYKEFNILNTLHGKVSYHVDHIYPISKGVAEHPKNLEVLTAYDNQTKSDKIPQDGRGYTVYEYRLNALS